MLENVTRTSYVTYKLNHLTTNAMKLLGHVTNISRKLETP